MYTKLLVPIDGSCTSLLALAQASYLAKLTGASIELLHVVNAMEYSNGFESPRAYIKKVRPYFLKVGNDLLDNARIQLEAQELNVTTVLVEAEGKRVSEHVADHAAKCQFDLIILGTHGRRGMQRLLLGSDAEQVARIAPVPVMLVRDVNTQAISRTLDKEMIKGAALKQPTDE
ncbi:universal stress protein [Halomonas sp. ATBC28]|jgi:nucleotide-binding universal stress UspA family protein|uniref:universal stress protein n=1 Tax=Halomonadaceae TaxID=28256 RepID=UPI00059AD362|nr:MULTISPECIES: universal stress protein [Halomonas]KIN16064.1 universal stress protein UspA [Halomonas sp. KHS3]TMU25588.1 universal stress protein [Halomonas sp. ATBC28]|tara:strand:+ start:495 stop:1016 length:522 start_codon:yes stop_codon:yes gene_type:complete